MTSRPEKTRVTTHTGQFPRFDEQAEGSKKEPPQPRTLPEMAEAGSTTGKLSPVILHESEDAARDADDSASRTSHHDAPAG
jgi:hypothetical protein